MLTFKYSNSRHWLDKDLHKGWTKEVRQDTRICYVNQVHEGIHAFLSKHCICKYKYFINQKRWGFEIGSDREAYLLLGDTADLIMRDAALLNEEVVTLELADPAFFDKLLAFLSLKGLIRTEEEIR